MTPEVATPSPVTANDSTMNHPAPAPVVGLTTGVTAVSVGELSACAITAGGGVECWGNNSVGELGNGSTTDSATPVPVSGLASSVSAVSVGFYLACAIENGGVLCWGVNAAGALGEPAYGDGSTVRSLVPVKIPGLASGVTAVGVGDGYACALTVDGAVLCWGANNYDELGSITTDSMVPLQVTGLTSGVTAISVGPVTACAITAGGGVVCWGEDHVGTAGISVSTYGTSTEIPHQVVGLTSGVTAISVGSGWDSGSSCAVVDGGVVCWGSNDTGQLGNSYASTGNCDDGSSSVCSSIPMQVPALTSGVTAISVGDGWACAIVEDGGVVCWGDDSGDELGNSAASTVHCNPNSANPCSADPVPVTAL
jgi:alpha-tubulin suppressor-like RCC1 family protein